MFRSESILDALTVLGAVLDERGVHFEAIVIGGANLLVSGVIERPTIDVDVVGQRAPDGELVSATPLPDAVDDAVAVVAQLRGLPRDWFNSVSGSEIRFGLPDGCMERLRPEEYGGLTVLWMHRRDLVALKLVAAVDQLIYARNKHLDDLRLLAPSSDELDHAIAWFERITAPASAAFSDLDRVLEEFGHAR